ncbi:MAG: MvdC/MvdD family ATP grasp protein [Terriglobales bacterium]
MNDPHVLIVSTMADVATDDVIRRIAARGVAYTRINTEDYPFSRTVSFVPDQADQSGWLDDGRPIQFPTSVWYRRMRTPPRPDAMDIGVYEFCLHETRATLLGALLGLTTRWMSHPAAIWSSEFKPFQLSLAARIGLPIPATVITNDPSAIRKAFDQFGAMIAKPVRRGHITQNGHTSAIFTSQVLKEHLDEIESARYSPAIYQPLIPKRFDVRVTIVGRQVFAAAIGSQSDPAAAIDWRLTSNPVLPHYPMKLPGRLTDQLQQLMESLGLTFGAIDLIQNTDGEFVFLEVNPNGQWLWLDNILNLGVSEAVADWLTGRGSA